MQLTYADDLSADIVFVIDISGSMETYIDKVREQLGNFASDLADNNINARYSVVVYETSADVHDFGGDMWTDNTEVLSNDLASIRCDGVTENIAAALQTVLSWDKSKWHSDNARTVFVLTDEPGDDDPTLLIDQLVDKNITVSVVTNLYFTKYQELSRETGGTLIDIQTDDWREAMRKVAILTNNLAKTEADERLPYSMISLVTSSDESTLKATANALNISSSEINLVPASNVYLPQDLTKISKDSYGSGIEFISKIDTLTLSSDSLGNGEYGYFFFKIDFAQTIIENTDINSLTIGNYDPINQSYGNGYVSFAMLDPVSNTKISKLQKTVNIVVYAKNGDTLTLYLVKDRTNNTLKLWSYNIATPGITYSSIRDKNRAWIHGFTMTQELRNSILAAFPGLNASDIHQFTDEEIIADDLTISYNDSVDIGKNGDSVIINFPTVLPAHSGVYVMRYDLTGAPSDKTLKVQGISQPLSDAFVDGDFVASSLENMSYQFFDESYKPIDKLSSDGSKVVYVAVRMTSAQQTSGVIVVNTALPQGTIMPIEDENSDILLETIANLFGLDINELYLLKPEHIFDPVEPSQEDLERIKREDHYEIVGRLNTLKVDITGYYVFQVELSEALYEVLKDVEIDGLKIYTDSNVTLKSNDLTTSELISAAASTVELLTMKGEKLDKINTKNLIMMLFLNAGQPLSLFIGKLILSILGFSGGCSVGVGISGVAVLCLLFGFLKRNRS